MQYERRHLRSVTTSCGRISSLEALWIIYKKTPSKTLMILNRQPIDHRHNRRQFCWIAANAYICARFRFVSYAIFRHGLRTDEHDLIYRSKRDRRVVQKISHAANRKIDKCGIIANFGNHRMGD